MDLVYVNSDFVCSATASSDKSSHDKGQKTFNKDHHRWTKVLLIALTVCLLFALGAVCTLAVFMARTETHFNVSVSDQEHNATDYKEQLDVLHIQHQEMLQKLNRLNESSGCALCAVHWTHSGGKCYYFSTVKMNWTQSRDHCVTKGGHLVIITSKAEQDFLASKISVTHWIGLNDMHTEGRWVWVDNQPLNKSVEFWMKRVNGNNEPDNWTKNHPGGEDCACLGHSLGATEFWNDDLCTATKRFVCEAAAAIN
ncbi:immune-related, lectin-like receptor 2 [Danio rerio]|uniref:Immune-related, lectin-like receptor 2 n=1 Tax=Danio rerio TaxID=7955 RepID=B0R0P1_DANRE|nr:immune-related, lectin-like receptor 2 [Danio rerio]|eukprot:NP_001121843.1 immune-related, lectin-like receptor 2 [Danio rerio]